MFSSKFLVFIKNRIFLVNRVLLVILTISSASFPAFAGEGRGYIAAQTRLFWHDALYAGQEQQNISLAGWYEYFQDNEDGDQRIALSLFGRADNEDDERSHMDIRELYWWKGFNEFELYAGVRKIFWGVTESVHLVDVINQDDLLENLDGEEKLGQPMLQVLTQRDWGLVEFFVLPGFREKSYPGVAGRLRPGLPIVEEARYQSRRKDKHIDWAVRWSHYFSIWDMSLSHFSGTHRDPYFFPIVEENGFDNDSGVALQAYYPQVDQSGLALQATVDAWLLKMEAISLKERDVGRNSAAVLGFEYTWFTLAGSNGDLGLVVEYQWDDRRGLRESLSQNDLALGARWAFNDLDGSEVLALVNQDLEKDNRFFSVELSRRLTDNWKLELEARIFSQAENDTFEYQLRNDDYLQVELRRYF